MERGAVVLADGHKRTRQYHVAERMYNIYYLMRRRGQASSRVRALVRFMVHFYGQEEIIGLTQRIAEEACEIDPLLRKSALETTHSGRSLFKQCRMNSLRCQILLMR